MLTKKILKAVLNVKHTAIDDMKILPDGSFAIMVHPTNKVYIVVDEPRVYCPEHGVVTAAVPWAMHKSRFTKEF